MDWPTNLQTDNWQTDNAGLRVAQHSTKHSIYIPAPAQPSKIIVSEQFRLASFLFLFAFLVWWSATAPAWMFGGPIVSPSPTLPHVTWTLYPYFIIYLNQQKWLLFTKPEVALLMEKFIENPIIGFLNDFGFKSTWVVSNTPFPFSLCLNLIEIDDFTKPEVVHGHLASFCAI